MAKLYFYYSAMNAGKSTVLLQSSHNYQERGMDTILFTPQLDDRFGVGRITSRIGLASEAVPFDGDFNLSNFTKNFKRDHPALACVLVDEAQFLSKKQVLQLTEVVDDLGIPVLAYGLRSDFLGEPFEGSQYLLILADNLVEIKTVCHCGKKAIMNARVNDNGKPAIDGEQVQIGGNETYISLCRKHYNELMQAARSPIDKVPKHDNA